MLAMSGDYFNAEPKNTKSVHLKVHWFFGFYLRYLFMKKLYYKLFGSDAAATETIAKPMNLTS